MKKHLLSAALFASVAAQAQPLPVDQTATRNRDPQMLTPFNGSLYFVAQDTVNGTELWKYSGTGVPTVAHDLQPGLASGAIAQNFKSMAVLGSAIYFIGDNGTTGRELFKYTGSGAATLATEINAGNALPSEVKNLASFANKVFFSARVSATGHELYSYDPTTNIATIFDFRPGTNSTEPNLLTPMGGKLYFQGIDNALGTELLAFDPATSAVALVSDVNTGPTGSDPQHLTVLGSSLYFVATTDTHGRELHRFNGTSTTRLTDLNAGTGDGVAASQLLSDNKVIGTYNGNI